MELRQGTRTLRHRTKTEIDKPGCSVRAARQIQLLQSARQAKRRTCLTDEPIAAPDSCHACAGHRLSEGHTVRAAPHQTSDGTGRVRAACRVQHPRHGREAIHTAHLRSSRTASIWENSTDTRGAQGNSKPRPKVPHFFAGQQGLFMLPCSSSLSPSVCVALLRFSCACG